MESYKDLNNLPLSDSSPPPGANTVTAGLISPPIDQDAQGNHNAEVPQIDIANAGPSQPPPSPPHSLVVSALPRRDTSNTEIVVVSAASSLTNIGSAAICQVRPAVPLLLEADKSSGASLLLAKLNSNDLNLSLKSHLLPPSDIGSKVGLKSDLLLDGMNTGSNNSDLTSKHMSENKENSLDSDSLSNSHGPLRTRGSARITRDPRGTHLPLQNRPHSMLVYRFTVSAAPLPQSNSSLRRKSAILTEVPNQPAGGINHENSVSPTAIAALSTQLEELPLPFSRSLSPNGASMSVTTSENPNGAEASKSSLNPHPPDQSPPDNKLEWSQRLAQTHMKPFDPEMSICARCLRLTLPSEDSPRSRSFCDLDILMQNGLQTYCNCRAINGSGSGSIASSIPRQSSVSLHSLDTSLSHSSRNDSNGITSALEISLDTIASSQSQLTSSMMPLPMSEMSLNRNETETQPDVASVSNPNKHSDHENCGDLVSAESRVWDQQRYCPQGKEAAKNVNSLLCCTRLDENNFNNNTTTNNNNNNNTPGELSQDTSAVGLVDQSTSHSMSPTSAGSVSPERSRITSTKPSVPSSECSDCSSIKGQDSDNELETGDSGRRSSSHTIFSKLLHHINHYAESHKVKNLFLSRRKSSSSSSSTGSAKSHTESIASDSTSIDIKHKENAPSNQKRQSRDQKRDHHHSHEGLACHTGAKDVPAALQAASQSLSSGQRASSANNISLGETSREHSSHSSRPAQSPTGTSHVSFFSLPRGQKKRQKSPSIENPHSAHVSSIHHSASDRKARSPVLHGILDSILHPGAHHHSHNHHNHQHHHHHHHHHSHHNNSHPAQQVQTQPHQQSLHHHSQHHHSTQSTHSNHSGSHNSSSGENEITGIAAMSASENQSSQPLYRGGSETSLNEKYGVSKEFLGKGAHATVRLAHKSSPSPMPSPISCGISGNISHNSISQPSSASQSHSHSASTSGQHHVNTTHGTHVASPLVTGFLAATMTNTSGSGSILDGANESTQGSEQLQRSLSITSKTTSNLGEDRMSRSTFSSRPPSGVDTQIGLQASSSDSSTSKASEILETGLPSDKIHVNSNGSSRNSGCAESQSEAIVSSSTELTTAQKSSMNSDKYVNQFSAPESNNVSHSIDSLHVTEQLYAIKKFRKRRRDESERDYTKKLSAEFCIASSLHHENVINTVDLIQDENENWCQVMEYMPGGDLFSRLTHGPRPVEPEEAYCLMVQLLDGVCYMHSMGVAHRDLKPENLLLSADGRQLKIADFGTAEVYRAPWTTKERRASGLFGSDPYIAPEEWGAENYEADKVDIWSTGIIFFVLVNGHLPWKAAVSSDRNYSFFLSARKKNKFTGIELMAKAPRRVIKKMLEPDPALRLSSQALLQDPWFTEVAVCRPGNAQNSHQHFCGVMNKRK